MKRIYYFLRWLPLYLLVIGLIAAFYWQESLSISLTGHDLFEIALLVVIFLAITCWTSHNEANFIVSKDWLKKNEVKNEQDNKVAVQLEHKND
jgi:hypothetical protein